MTAPRKKSGPADTEFCKTVARLFNSSDGDKVLKKLRDMTIERIASEDELSERALSHREGQRYIVGMIERWIRTGHEA